MFAELTISNGDVTMKTFEFYTGYRFDCLIKLEMDANYLREYFEPRDNRFDSFNE